MIFPSTYERYEQFVTQQTNAGGQLQMAAHQGFGKRPDFCCLAETVCRMTKLLASCSAELVDCVQLSGFRILSRRYPEAKENWV